MQLEYTQIGDVLQATGFGVANGVRQMYPHNAPQQISMLDFAKLPSDVKQNILIVQQQKNMERQNNSTGAGIGTYEEPRSNGVGLIRAEGSGGTLMKSAGNKPLTIVLDNRLGETDAVVRLGGWAFIQDWFNETILPAGFVIGDGSTYGNKTLAALNDFTRSGQAVRLKGSTETATYVGENDGRAFTGTSFFSRANLGDANATKQIVNYQSQFGQDSYRLNILNMQETADLTLNFELAYYRYVPKGVAITITFGVFSRSGDVVDMKLS